AGDGVDAAAQERVHLHGQDGVGQARRQRGAGVLHGPREPGQRLEVPVRRGEVAEDREGGRLARVVERVEVVRRPAPARGRVEGGEAEVRGRGTGGPRHVRAGRDEAAEVVVAAGVAADA